MNPQNYTINIRPGWGISPVVKVSQGDVGRPLAFTIMDGQDALTIATGTTVTIKGTKPSTLGFTQTCELSGNTASVETTATMTQEAGAVQAELILTQGTTVIGSANFVLYVEPAAHPEGTTDGDAETARDLMTRATAAVEQAETYAQQAQDAAESIEETGISAAGAAAGQVPTANGSNGWSWEDPEGGGTSDDIENKSSVSGATVTAALSSLSDEIASLSGGAPTPAATVPAMVDTTKIYLYTGAETGYTAGHWYYYSGGQWVDGGKYGEESAINAQIKRALLLCAQNVVWKGTDGQDYYDQLRAALEMKTASRVVAVFDQTGVTIYETYTLDTLKPYLTVTVEYDDGTTGVTAIYELSGTLESGTSTITVTVDQVSTTFNVSVTGRLPSGYRQIQYLESDGTQVIDTGVIPRNTMTQMEFEFTGTKTNEDNILLAVWNANNMRYYPVWLDSTGRFVFKNRANNARWNGDYNPTVVHDVVFNNASNQSLYDDEVKATDTTFAITSGDGTLTLFARHSGTNYEGLGIGRVYTVYFEDNDTGDAIGNFIPCYRKSDGAGGVYDTVTGEFMTDVNSGNAFTLGPTMWESV